MKLLALLILVLLLAIPLVANAQDGNDDETDPTPPVTAGEGDNTVPDDWFDGFVQAAFVMSVAVMGAVEKTWKPLVKFATANLDIPAARQKLFNNFLIVSGAIVLSGYFVLVQGMNLLADTGNVYLENAGELVQQVITIAFVVAFAVFGAEVYDYVRRLAKAV